MQTNDVEEQQVKLVQCRSNPKEDEVQTNVVITRHHSPPAHFLPQLSSRACVFISLLVVLFLCVATFNLGILDGDLVFIASSDEDDDTAHEPVANISANEEQRVLIRPSIEMIEPSLPALLEDIWSKELDFAEYPLDWIPPTTMRPSRTPTVRRTRQPVTRRPSTMRRTREPVTRRPTTIEEVVTRKPTFKKTPKPTTFRPTVSPTPAPTRRQDLSDLDPQLWTDPKALQLEVNSCEDRRKQDRNGARDYLLRADCGLGYELGKKTTNTWRVFFAGSDWDLDRIRGLSGCPKTCPLSPNCELSYDTETSQHNLDQADVVVAFSYGYQALRKRVPDSVKHRVVYWREASWHGPPINFQKSRLFTFEMGVHFNAAILNPSFVTKPSKLLKGMYMDQKKEFFAASVISDCEARSKRDDYLRLVMDALSGTGLRADIHRFGKCGTRDLPGDKLNDALQHLAKYKFYFSFENTIQEHYVTEKLFTALLLPVVPIFYGSALVPNITSTPSFIKASDFASPTLLAEYLVFLDKNPAEYAKYGQWRKLRPSEAFTAEYLETLEERVPGPSEIQAHGGSERAAQCCRLCNQIFVERASERRKKDSLVNEPMAVEEIDSKYFSGALGKS